jgi:hypothetical protein
MASGANTTRIPTDHRTVARTGYVSGHAGLEWLLDGMQAVLDARRGRLAGA